MLELKGPLGWRSVAVAALVAVLLWTALTEPPKHEYDVAPDYSASRIVYPISTDERIADYTEALAWLTAVLAVIATVGIAMTYQQIKLGREEFSATHRPRIRVRGIGGPAANEKNIYTFRVVVANAGESEAVITNCVIEGFDHDHANHSDRSEFPLDPCWSQGDKIKLAPGQGYAFEPRLKNWISQQVNIRNGPLILVGIVTYEDAGGIVRHTGFARIAIKGDYASRVLEDYKEFEYED